MKDVNTLYETTHMSIKSIAEVTNLSFNTVYEHIRNRYTEEYQNQRKREVYRLSKLGDKNLQFGKYGETSSGYIDDVSDGKGYLMRTKPSWYTGRVGCKHVFVHHLVICETLGLTEIPKGFCVHHIDGEKANNELVNLALMTTSAHMRLHQLERATTSRKA